MCKGQGKGQDMGQKAGSGRHGRKGRGLGEIAGQGEVHPHIQVRAGTGRQVVARGQAQGRPSWGRQVTGAWHSEGTQKAQIGYILAGRRVGHVALQMHKAVVAGTGEYQEGYRHGKGRAAWVGAGGQAQGKGNVMSSGENGELGRGQQLVDANRVVSKVGR